MQDELTREVPNKKKCQWGQELYITVRLLYYGCTMGKFWEASGREKAPVERKEELITEGRSKT